MSNERRFKDVGEASKELFDGFNEWSSAIAVHSLQAAYAIIAANWAVYGNANHILNTPFASKFSMAIIIGFLGLNLLGTSWMTYLYERRCRYADKNKERWEEEFNKESTTESPWPYTKSIENIGFSLRMLKTWAPVIAGVAFIWSLF